MVISGGVRVCEIFWMPVLCAMYSAIVSALVLVYSASELYAGRTPWTSNANVLYSVKGQEQCVPARRLFPNNLFPQYRGVFLSSSGIRDRCVFQWLVLHIFTIPEIVFVECGLIGFGFVWLFVLFVRLLVADRLTLGRHFGLALRLFGDVWRSFMTCGQPFGGPWPMSRKQNVDNYESSIFLFSRVVDCGLVLLCFMCGLTIPMEEAWLRRVCVPQTFVLLSVVCWTLEPAGVNHLLLSPVAKPADVDA